METNGMESTMGHLLSLSRASNSTHFRNAIDASRGGFDFVPAMCLHATNAPPGSPEKLAVLAKRYSDGVELWHQGDAQSQDENLT